MWSDMEMGVIVFFFYLPLFCTAHTTQQLTIERFGGKKMKVQYNVGGTILEKLRRRRRTKNLC